MCNIGCWSARDGKMNGADLFKSLTRVSPDFELLTTDEKLLMIIDEGCKHRPILKTILDMWIARFN